MNRLRRTAIVSACGLTALCVGSLPIGAAAAASAQRPADRAQLDPAAARSVGVIVPRHPAAQVAATAVGDRYWVAIERGWAGLRDDPRVTSIWDNEVFRGVAMTLSRGQVAAVKSRPGVTSVERMATYTFDRADLVRVLAVSAGDGSVALRWNAVPSRATEVQLAVVGDSSWVPAEGCARVAHPLTSCVVTGLDNGQQYVLRVRALHATGPGPWSAASAPVAPAEGLPPPLPPLPTLTPTPTPSPTLPLPPPPTPMPTPSPTTTSPSPTPTPTKSPRPTKPPSPKPTPTPSPTARPTTHAYAWGRDRLDQPDLPLDHEYQPAGDGTGVHIYVVDSGIQADHGDFTGRVGRGRSVYQEDDPNRDCVGHGTHVAGTAAGAPAVGVATGAKLHSVVVLDCEGEASDDALFLGLEWIRMHARHPAIVNMSLGSADRRSPVWLANELIQLTEMGIPVVVAAGNDPWDACLTSPADIPPAISVGATNRRDVVPEWDAYGRCIDVFAPGVDVLSTDYRYNPEGVAHRGTSMAAPHVTGAIAVTWSLHPKMTGTQAAAATLAGSVSGVQFPTGGHGAPLLLAQVPSEADPAPDPNPTTPTPDPTENPTGTPSPANTTEPLSVTGSDPVPGLLAGAALISLGSAGVLLGGRRQRTRGGHE